MNFFKAQDQARKSSFRLIALFVVAVTVLVLLTNLCVAVFVWYSDPGHYVAPESLQEAGLFALLGEMFEKLGWVKILWISALVWGGVLIASLFKWLDLRSGGRVVAESLGGRRLQPDTRDFSERRLLNVVEEMALASGMPVPPVYLLENEQGINAFAAGLTTKDAVIGVTKGSIEKLNREQLQGVIAHEFSHILNGDMLLNTRVLAVLHGILMIGESGRTLLEFGSRGFRYRSRNDKNSLTLPLFLLGAALWLIGLLGQFFGAMIKSAVSRQREYLADASAVQFTRNPQGIGGALRVIGQHAYQSRLGHHRAHEMGHMFFSKAYASWSGMFATHPPLAERIKRVLPGWDGHYLEPSPELSDDAMEQSASQASFASTPDLDAIEFVTPVLAVSGLNSVDGTVSSQPSGSADRSNCRAAAKASDLLAAELAGYCREPLTACAFVFAVLMHESESGSPERSVMLKQIEGPWAASLETVYPAVEQLDPADVLGFLKRAMSSLKLLSKPQYLRFRQQLLQMIHADKKVVLFEWVVFVMVRQYCDVHFELLRPKPPKYRQMSQVTAAFEIVLSRLIHLGHPAEESRQAALQSAISAGDIDGLTLLPLDQCNLKAFNKAASRLMLAFPLLKPRLLKALIAAARHDGRLMPQEVQLVSALALILDCPLIGLHDFE